MKTVFLETSAINRCLKESIAGDELANILKKKCLSPVVSIHTTYELARTFLNEKTADRGAELFQIIKRLKPTFSCLTPSLILKDIRKLRDDEPVTYLLSNDQLKTLNTAIERLAEGNFLCEHRKFIEKREQDIKKEYVVWDKVIENVTDRPKSFSNFADNYIKTENTSHLIKHIYQHTNIKLNHKEVDNFIRHKSHYSALRTLIYSNLYFNFIAMKYKTRPGKDKTDDLRHLIDSSYCATLLSNDEQLLKIANDINPDIEVLSWNKLLAL